MGKLTKRRVASTKCSAYDDLLYQQQHGEKQEELEVVESTSNSPSGPGPLIVGNVASAVSRLPTQGAVGRAPVTGGSRQLLQLVDAGTVPLRRCPRCARCRGHGVLVPLKGHKKLCKWQNCKCANCQLITARQKLMARHIAVCRQQDIEEMAAVAMQQSAAAFTLPGDEAPDLGVKNPGSTSLTLVQSGPRDVSQPPANLMSNNQGNLHAHSLHASPHYSIPCQWESNTSTGQSTPDFSSEIQSQLPSGGEADVPSPILGASSSHGAGGRGSSFGPLMTFAPYNNYGHQQLPFPFGLSTPKFAAATNQIYSPNFLIYQQQQQQQLQVQMPQQYRLQGSNSFGNSTSCGAGGCAGDLQSAFVPIGHHQIPLAHHSPLVQDGSPSPITSADSFDEAAVLATVQGGDGASGTEPACEVPTSNIARNPVASRTVRQAFPSSSSTMSNFHPLPAAALSTQARSFIPLQNALFPQKTHPGQ